MPIWTRTWATTRPKISTTKNSRFPSSGRAVPFALGLGANLGDPGGTLRRAVRQLRAALGNIDLRVSPLYRSEPVPPGPQPAFFNLVVVGRSALPPDALLAVSKALELQAGRQRGERFGPRVLDIDLLLYGQQASSAPELTLPHPRLAERRFVLAPLADLAPDWRVPPGQRTVAQLLADLGNAGGQAEVVARDLLTSPPTPAAAVPAG